MGAHGLGKPTASGFGLLFNPVTLITATGWCGTQRGYLCARAGCLQGRLTAVTTSPHTWLVSGTWVTSCSCHRPVWVSAPCRASLRGGGRRREYQAEPFVGLAGPLATAQSCGSPECSGSWGRVSCVQDKGDCGLVTPA